MSGPTVCGETGPSGFHAISPAPRPASRTGHVACHVCRDVEADLASVGGLIIGPAVNHAATAAPRETSYAIVKPTTRDGAARHVSIIYYAQCRLLLSVQFGLLL